MVSNIIQNTSTSAIVHNMEVTAGDVNQAELLYIKVELSDTDVDVGPTVLQQMDSHYRISQNTSTEHESDSQSSTTSNLSNTRQIFLNAIENQSQPSKRKKRSAPAERNDLLARAFDLLSQSQQQEHPSFQIDPLVIHWTQKLQKLNPTQRIYAEKAMNDILFEAELNNLQRHSVQINNISILPPTSFTPHTGISSPSLAHVIENSIDNKHVLIPKTSPDKAMDSMLAQPPSTISNGS